MLDVIRRPSLLLAFAVCGLLAPRLSFAAPLFGDLCNGDGGNQAGCTNCPCGNNAAPGTIGGCVNSAGTSARLIESGSHSLTAPNPTDLQFMLTGAPPSSFVLLKSGGACAALGGPCIGLQSGVPSVFFDGLRCAVTGTLNVGVRAADANGDVGITNNPWGGPAPPAVGIGNQGGFISGQTRYFQAVYRDISFGACMKRLNTSQAIDVMFIA